MVARWKGTWQMGLCFCSRFLSLARSKYGREQRRPRGQALRWQLKDLSRNKARIMQGRDRCNATRKLNDLGESRQMGRWDVKATRWDIHSAIIWSLRLYLFIVNPRTLPGLIREFLIETELGQRIPGEQTDTQMTLKSKIKGKGEAHIFLKLRWNSERIFVKISPKFTLFIHFWQLCISQLHLPTKKKKIYLEILSHTNDTVPQSFFFPKDLEAGIWLLQWWSSAVSYWILYITPWLWIFLLNQIHSDEEERKGI